MVLGSYQRKGVQRIAVREVVRNGLQRKSFSDKKEDKTRIEAKDRDWLIERAKHTDVAHTDRGWCFSYRARRTKNSKITEEEVWAPTAIRADHTHRKERLVKTKGQIC